ncbi:MULTISPECIES: OsmC family protein [unclassified Streptomyces]|uniref:OsmC family protein n=1 Tax=unclassified Streptomyces TaxID=2593676 RepID=UPI003448E297
MTNTIPDTSAAREPQPAVEHRLDITHVDGDVYEVDIRGHRLLVDQPVDAGGTDIAPTPVELFAASLATCVAFYAGRYLKRHGLPRDGLRVRSEFTMATDLPARVESLCVVVVPPPELPAHRHAALLAVATHCTVHNTLQEPPAIRVEVER